MFFLLNRVPSGPRVSHVERVARWARGLTGMRPGPSAVWRRGF